MTNDLSLSDTRRNAHGMISVITNF